MLFHFPFHTVVSGASAAGGSLSVLRHVAAGMRARAESDWYIPPMLSPWFRCSSGVIGCFRIVLLGLLRMPTHSLL